MPRGIYKRSDKTLAHLKEIANNRPESWYIKQKESHSGKVFTKETTDRMSISHKKRYEDPEEHIKTINVCSGVPKRNTENYHGLKSEDHKRKIGEAHKDKIVSEDQILKIIETKIGGFWYGNIRYGNPVYCEKWDDVNPRVHAFFDYHCCLCGAPENGKSHTGHHVFYVKKACCWFNENGIYYTNLNARNHPQNDYLIGDNPNYFVILCPSCHGKTNGNFENRKYWADYFRKLIDEKYNGKCYLTKEEYHLLTVSKNVQIESEIKKGVYAAPRLPMAVPPIPIKTETTI